MRRQAYFELSAGNRVTNVISYGPSGGLLLIFTFANGIPGFPPSDGSPASEVAATIGAGIDYSIKRIRELVVDSTIKAK
jgi:hypothetical protein